MHTMSMRARQVVRWRWILTALALIVAQAVVAVAVRSSAPVSSRPGPISEAGVLVR